LVNEADKKNRSELMAPTSKQHRKIN